MITPKRMKLRNKFIKLREWLLEDQANIGLGGPPNNWRHKQFSPTTHAGDTGVEYYFAKFGNDASEIWIGNKWIDGEEKWRIYLTATVFRKMALWYLRRWIFGEWLGLRRKLYFHWLSKSVERMRRHSPVKDARDD